MKAFRKKPVIISVSCLLAAVLAAGGIVLAVKNSGTPVPVAPVSTMNSGYWNDNSDIAPYGNVTTNLNQDISYDESLIITQVYVQEGDTVQVGDPLVSYDTSLVALELEMKQMQIDGIGLNIQNVQAELDQLKKTAPAATASASPLAGVLLAASRSAGTSGAPGVSETAASGSSSGQTPLPPGTVWQKITPDSVPYQGNGTRENPFRYYVFPEEGKATVTVDREYLKQALNDGTVSIFDTVDSLSDPSRIVSSWEMDFASIMELIQDSRPGTPFPEELKGQPVWETITADSAPYNIDSADGTEQNPFRFLCVPGVRMDGAFLRSALAHQTVSVFEVVDDAASPSRILYSFTLNGQNAASDPDDPDDPDDPGTEDPGTDEPGTEDPDMEDPGIYDPGSDIPDIDIPAGPTKDELDRQIREKEELLKSLDLDKRTAGLELIQLQKKLSEGTVTSTVNGTVKAVRSEEDARLENAPLISVVGEEGFYITGAVAETAYDKIEQGMDVTVTSWNDGMTYEASVTSVSSTPAPANSYGNNPNMSYYPFTAVIRGEASLQNGDGVDLSVPGLESGGSSDGIYLSQAFVREESGRSYVYKKGEKDRLTKQYVETGKIVYGTVEIRSGLDMEDEIAFPYGRDVKEGAKTRAVDTLYDYGY